MAKENNQIPIEFKIGPWLIYAAILIIFLLIFLQLEALVLQEASIDFFCPNSMTNWEKANKKSYRLQQI